MENYRQIWKGILNIGRRDTLHYLEVQRNAILNAVLVSAVFLIAAITLIYTVLGFDYNLIPLIALPICFLSLWLNYETKYILAKQVAFFGFLTVIAVWSFCLRRCYNELLFITLACGSASIFSQRKSIFLAMLTCSVFYFVCILYDKATPFVPNPTVDYFIIKSILAYTTAGTVFFLTIVFVDMTTYISRKLDKNFEELQAAFENQKEIEKKLLDSNNELAHFNMNLDLLAKQANEDLYAYQAAIDDNLQSIVTDGQGIILKVNDLYLRKTGYSKEELMGKSIDILKSDYHNDAFYANISETISSGTVWRGESKIKTKNGTIFWISSSILPVLDNNGKIAKYLTISTDVTDKKIAEEKEQKAILKLIESEKRLSLFLENQTDLVVITDKHGNRKYVNKSFCKFFDKDKEHFIGTNYRTYDSNDLDYAYLELFDSISYENPKTTTVIVRQNALGEKRWIQWNEIAFFDADENVIEILSIGHDITEMKENENQNANYITQFEELAFQNSHHFRRPLSNIIGVINLIDEESTIVEVKELIAIVKDEISELDVASHELSDFINANSNTIASIVNNQNSFELDFTNDKVKHLKWKFKVRNFLDGKGSLNLSQAILPVDCETGKWFNTIGKEKYAAFLSFDKFEKEHENLHHLVTEIIGLKEENKTQKAEEKYMELVQSIDKIILILDEAENSINTKKVLH
jgi:PAS domain S-box-containing protein